MIRTQQSFSQSILFQIERMLRDFQGFISDHFQEIVSRAAVVHLQSAFIALAVHSMEGKTQSAFVFRDVKPLYFPLSGYRSEQAPQPIYGNFTHLSDAIVHYAALDLSEIRRIRGRINIPRYSDFDDGICSTPL